MKVPLASLVVLVIMVMAVIMVKGQGMTPSQCKEEKNLLSNTCRSVAVFFGRKPPTIECCQLVRDAHVECVCPYVTWKLVAALGGLQRAINMIESCGRNVPRSFNCGSITTPP